MVRFLLVLGLFALSACDLPQSYAQPPKAEKAEPAPSSGVSVSGYARVGVSHKF